MATHMRLKNAYKIVWKVTLQTISVFTFEEGGGEQVKRVFILMSDILIHRNACMFIYSVAY